MIFVPFVMWVISGCRIGVESPATRISPRRHGARKSLPTPPIHNVNRAGRHGRRGIATPPEIAFPTHSRSTSTLTPALDFLPAYYRIALAHTLNIPTCLDIPIKTSLQALHPFPTYAWDFPRPAKDFELQPRVEGVNKGQAVGE